ncbi:hypothetical protein OUZ56_010924 [Daphnia magna]|uniref:Uncharacterized protein n=1 Tax=Daphnia magna TaxID=35525 RepID=A0ABQ9Z020_9CRUS|nr:hypothetical protein OUZ56_010924 [Daphnia magna]
MDIIDDLSTELKELTVPDLDTHEELEEVEHASFREVVEYCLTATYRATCIAHTLGCWLVVGDAMKAISDLGSHSALAWGELSHHELGVLKELTVLLQPFEDATNDLQGVYETTGNVIPCYLDLLNKSDQILQTNCQRLKKITHKAFNLCSTRYFLFLGTMLNPMIKKKWISKSGESDWAVVAAFKAELEMRAQQLQVSQPNLTEKKNCVPICAEASNEARQLYSTLLDEPSENQSGSTFAAVIEEFDTFLNEPLSSMRELVDPLKANGQTKPRIAKKCNLIR